MEPQQPIQNNENRALTGLLLIGVGIVLFAYKLGAPLPPWLISWHTGLIALGILIGVRHRFRNPGWLILVLIGTIFLLDDMIPSFNLQNFIGPIIIIAVGLLFIFRPKRSERWASKWREKNSYSQWNWNNPVADTSASATAAGAATEDGEFINSTSVLGGVKKVILSKNFKGGDIVCFLGGAEIDLTQADIQQTTVLEITQVFGGTKLIVPAHWNIRSEVTAIFGGIEDKRTVLTTAVDSNKTLVLRGTTVFGGLEIKNY